MLHAARVGRLHRLHPGVYAVGHTALSREARWLAAVLACGPGAVLSYRDAAALHGVRTNNRSRIDVTTPNRGRKAHPGVDVHRTRRLQPHETCTRRAIPATTLNRTIVDLADDRRIDLEAVLHQAEINRQLDLSSLGAAVDDATGRRGQRRLQRLIATLDPAPPTRRELERIFLRLCRDHDIPRPDVNTVVGGYEVDFHWPSHRLIVETDGRATHLTRRAFEADRARDEVLTVAGYRVVRFTWRRVTEEPDAVAATLRTLLELP